MTAGSLDGAQLVAVEGEIDMAAAPEIDRAADAQLGERGNRMVLDLSETTFMDSSGIHLIERLTRETLGRAGRLVVVVATDGVRLVLGLVPPGELVDVVSSRQQALTALSTTNGNGRRSATQC